MTYTEQVSVLLELDDETFTNECKRIYKEDFNTFSMLAANPEIIARSNRLIEEKERILPKKTIETKALELLQSIDHHYRNDNLRPFKYEIETLLAEAKEIKK